MWLANRFIKPMRWEFVCPSQGPKSPKSAKEGFGVKKTAIPHHSRKGRSESKNPHFYTEHYKESGACLTRNTLFWGGGKWFFLFDSETLFS